MKIKYLLYAISLTCMFYSCSYSNQQRHDDAQIDSIKLQLDTLLGSEGPKIDSLAHVGMAKSKDSTDYYYFLLYHASVKMWANDHSGFDSLLYRFKRYADKAAPSPALNDLFAKYYVLCGNSNMVKLIFNDALKDYKLAYSYQKRGTRPLYKITILTDMSDSYLAMPNYAMAASCLREVRLLSDSLNNMDAKIQALMGLASIYTGLANYQEANQYFKEVGKLLPDMHGRQLFHYYNTLGNYYFYKGDYNNTLKVFKMINTHLKSFTDNDFDRNIAWLNLADAYIRTGHIDSAEVYHEKCKKFYIKNNNKTTLYYLETQHIALLLEKNRLKEVGRLLKRKAESSVESQQIRLRYKYLVDYYTRIGDDHHALVYLKLFTHINDSVNNATQKLATDEAALRYQQDSKTLRLNLALSKTHEHYRTAQLLLILALLVILLLSVAFFSITRHNKTRRAQILKDARKRILKLRMEELRNRVSPHFIFNVLNYEMYERQQGEKGTDINRLVRLIRSGLEQSDEISVPLYKELDFIDVYVELQRHGLSGSFEYHLSIAQDVDDNTRIPSMIIQIAVENAIKHGLRGVEGNTRLDIDICNIDHVMQVLVTDNGRGLELSESKEDSTGTGMRVIRETLQMLNEHNQHQMVYEMTSNPNGKGCRVKILIPLTYDYSLAE